MGVKRRLSKGRNRGKSGGAEAEAEDLKSISLILQKYYSSDLGSKPITFAALLTDINIKANSDQSADGPAGDLTTLNGINNRYNLNPYDLEALYNNLGDQMVTDGGSSRRRKRRRTKKRRSAKHSVKRAKSAKRRKARR